MNNQENLQGVEEQTAQTYPRDGEAGQGTPSIPHGWRGKPAGDSTGASGTAAAGWGKPVKKRRIRRGGGGGESVTTSLTILNNNVCGWNSKKASMPDILEKLVPDVCTFQETGLTGDNQMKIKNYHASLRNRRKKQENGRCCYDGAKLPEAQHSKGQRG